jgi:hypothetical protein
MTPTTATAVTLVVVHKHQDPHGHSARWVSFHEAGNPESDFERGLTLSFLSDNLWSSSFDDRMVESRYCTGTNNCHHDLIAQDFTATPNVIEIVKVTPSEISTRINGARQNYITPTSTADPLVTEALSLGFGHSGHPAKASIAEVVFFPSDVSDAELQAIGQELGGRYGIPFTWSNDSGGNECTTDADGDGVDVCSDADDFDPHLKGDLNRDGRDDATTLDAISASMGDVFYGSKWYYFYPSGRSWAAAAAQCHAYGGQLARLDPDASTDLAYLAAGSATWFDLRDVNGFWQDSDGNVATMTNWAQNFPRGTPGTCVSLSFDGNGEWIDDACEASYSFMCEFDDTPHDVVDADGDGITSDMDCDDSRPGDGIVECQDGDNDGVLSTEDCDDTTAGNGILECIDDDGDSVFAHIDCNDSLPGDGTTECLDEDNDGVVAGEDCDDTIPGDGTSECAEPVDADSDGYPDTIDCDDNDPFLNLDDNDGDGLSTCDGDPDDSDANICGDFDDDSYDDCSTTAGSGGPFHFFFTDGQPHDLGTFEYDWQGAVIAGGEGPEGGGAAYFYNENSYMALGPIDFGGGDFVLQTYVKFEQINEYSRIFGDWDNSDGRQLGLAWEDGAFRFYWSLDKIEQEQLVFTCFPVPNEWYHVAIERTGSILTLFVDGVEVDSGYIPAHLPLPSIDGFTIGRWSMHDQSQFVGYLEHIQYSTDHADRLISPIVPNAGCQ